MEANEQLIDLLFKFRLYAHRKGEIVRGTALKIKRNEIFFEKGEIVYASEDFLYSCPRDIIEFIDKNKQKGTGLKLDFTIPKNEKPNYELMNSIQYWGDLWNSNTQNLNR